MGVKGHLRPVGVGFVTLRRFAVGTPGGYGFVTFRPSSCRPPPANRSSAVELPSKDRFTFAAASTQDRQRRTLERRAVHFLNFRPWSHANAPWAAVLLLLADEDHGLFFVVAVASSHELVCNSNV